MILLPDLLTQGVQPRACSRRRAGRAARARAPRVGARPLCVLQGRLVPDGNDEKDEDEECDDNQPNDESKNDVRIEQAVLALAIR